MDQENKPKTIASFDENNLIVFTQENLEEWKSPYEKSFEDSEEFYEIDEFFWKAITVLLIVALVIALTL